MCDNQAQGKARTCSGKCRKAYSRTVTGSVTTVTKPKPETVTTTVTDLPPSVTKGVTLESVTKENVTVNKDRLNHPTEAGTPERKEQIRLHPEWFIYKDGMVLTKPGTPSSALCTHYLLDHACTPTLPHA